MAAIARLLQSVADRLQDAIHHLAAIAPGRLDLLGQHPVAHRVEVLERQFLQLEIQRVQAQAVGDRRVDVEGLAGDALAMRGRHRVERAHVVQPVRELDQYDANVLRHRQQHLAETLGLLVLARLELDVVELGHAVDHVGDELAERCLDLGLGDLGVLHDVVEERRGEPLRVEPPLRQDAGDGQRVRDVGFARLAKLALMRVFGKRERALDQRYVRRGQVVTKVSGEFGDFRHAWSLRGGVVLIQL